MDMQPVPEVQSHGKVHTWILIMSVWTLVMTIVIVGLMVTNGANTNDSTEALAAACENGATNAINAANTTADEETDDAEDDASCETPANLTYGGQNSNNMLPRLVYPYGWSAILHTATTSFEAFPQYIWDCEGCGGIDTSSKLYVQGLPVDQAYEMDIAKLQTQYTEDSKADDYEATNIVINSKTYSNGSAVFIDGHENVQAAGGGDYDFHEVLFKTSSTFVFIRFVDYNENLSTEWNAIKASLDFSSVK